MHSQADKEIRVIVSNQTTDYKYNTQSLLSDASTFKKVYVCVEKFQAYVNYASMLNRHLFIQVGESLPSTFDDVYNQDDNGVLFPSKILESFLGVQYKDGNADYIVFDFQSVKENWVEISPKILESGLSISIRGLDFKQWSPYLPIGPTNVNTFAHVLILKFKLVN